MTHIRTATLTNIPMENASLFASTGWYNNALRMEYSRLMNCRNFTGDLIVNFGSVVRGVEEASAKSIPSGEFPSSLEVRV